MKKILLLLSIPVILILYLLYFISTHHSVKVIDKPVVVTKTITMQAMPPTAPVFHVGDTQDGITLLGVYPYSYQNMMEGNGASPPTVHLLYFAVSGVSGLVGHTQVLTTDGNYLVTDGPSTIPACGDNLCVGYIATGQPAAFYYKDLKWEL